MELEYENDGYGDHWLALSEGRLSLGAFDDCGCGAQAYYDLNTREARELRDALDKWINEGGADVSR